MKNDSEPALSQRSDRDTQDTYEFEEYHVFEEHPVEEIVFSYEPVPVESVEYEELLRESRVEIDEVRSNLHLTNQGLEDHYSYDNRERLADWLDETRVKNLEQVLKLGSLAKRILDKRREIVGVFPELEHLKDEYYDFQKKRMESLERFTELKRTDPEKVEERRVVAREWRRYKEEQEEAMSEYRRVFPRTMGVNNRAGLEDLGVSFNDTQSIRALLGSIILLGRSEMEEVIAYALRYFPKTWLRHLRLIIELGGVEGAEGYVDRDLRDGPYLLSAAGEITVVLHEIAHIVEAQNPYIGRLERDFLLWLEERGGVESENDYYYVSEELIKNIAAAVKDDKLEEGITPEEKRFSKCEYIDEDGEKIGYSYEVLTYGLQAIFSPAQPEDSFHHSSRDATVHEEFILGLLLYEP